MSRRRRQRREVPEIGLSFLDVISCGFGAIILLLIITRNAEPIVLENTVRHIEGQLAALVEELMTIRGEVKVLNRELTVKQEQLDDETESIARLQAELSALRGQFAASDTKGDEIAEYEGRLARARQSLSEEMERLLGANFRRTNDTIGGIPVDSEYIIFIIDTSGSMFSYAWPLVLQKINEVLDIYPEVKGVQVMNDMGDYMFSRYQDRWIPDTPARRRAIIERLRTWNAFSNSSPVEGIERAVASFYDPGKKISLYVFGDDFTGASITQVVETVDRLNAADADGTRRVRIHGIGFPVQFQRGAPGQGAGGFRFSALMRELCARNGGTFVALPAFE